MGFPIYADLFDNPPPVLTCEIVFYSDEPHESFSGGDNRNPNWREYLSIHYPWADYLELIREAIEIYDYVGITGEEMQNRGMTFKFSDGNHFGFTWRAWGDLMQAIVGNREGYMRYYM